MKYSHSNWWKSHCQDWLCNSLSTTVSLYNSLSNFHSAICEHCPWTAFSEKHGRQRRCVHFDSYGFFPLTLEKFCWLYHVCFWKNVVFAAGFFPSPGAVWDEAVCSGCAARAVVFPESRWMAVLPKARALSSAPVIQGTTLLLHGPLINYLTA